MSRHGLDGLVRKRKLTRIRRGSQWVYPRAEVLALARERAAAADEQEGTTESIALGLMREGRTDGEIVESTRLSLREVERLRMSQGELPSAERVQAALVKIAPRRGRPKKDPPDEEPAAPPVARARDSLAKTRSRLETIRASARQRAYGDD
jgi:hypothetical protein